MTLKELKANYVVTKWEGTYLVYSKENLPNTRMVHKYLCEVKKVGNAFYILGGTGVPAKNLNAFQSQLEVYLSELKYDSEYYCPALRLEARMEYLVIDILQGYGFKQEKFSDTWRLSRGSIYGYNATDIKLSYDINNKFAINLWSSPFSWVSAISELDFDDIKNTIDGMLKPLLLSEGVMNIQSAGSMGNTKMDYVLKELKGLDIESENLNEVLKEKLLTLANSL